MASLGHTRKQQFTFLKIIRVVVKLVESSPSPWLPAWSHNGIFFFLCYIFFSVYMYMCAEVTRQLVGAYFLLPYGF